MSFVGFGNRSSGGGGGDVTDAANLGLGEGTFAQKNGTILEYKSLAEGAGITLSSDGTEITITNSGSAGTFPLRNVLFLNTNGYVGVPVKGNINRPYQTWAEAILDYSAANGDVIWVLDDRDEEITLIPDLKVVGFNVALDNSAAAIVPSTIYDGGVSCNAIFSGYFKVKSTSLGGECLTLSGVTSNVTIEGEIEVAEEGLRNLSNGSVHIKGEVNFLSTADKGIRGSNFIIDGNVKNFSNTLTVCDFTSNITINGNFLLDVGLLTASNLQFISGFLTINGNVDIICLPNSAPIFEAGVVNVVRGNIDSVCENGIFQAIDDVTVYGNIVCPQLAYTNSSNFKHIGNITCVLPEGFAIAGGSNFTFIGGIIEYFSPVYALAGGGILDVDGVTGNGYIHTNDSCIESCIDVIWDGELFCETIQNIPFEQAPLKLCTNVRHSGIIHVDFGFCSLAYRNTNMYLNSSIIIDGLNWGGFSVGGGRNIYGGGIAIVDDRTVLSNTTITALDVISNADVILIWSWSGVAYNVYTEGGLTITAPLTTPPKVTPLTDFAITFIDGWIKNYDGSLKHTLLATPDTIIVTNNEGYQENSGLSGSITVVASNVQLKNDEATPTASKYYGTNSVGDKGFHELAENSGVQTIVAGSNIAVNAADPANPIVSSTPVTTAGIISLVFFTGDEEITTEGTFYLTNRDSKGTVAEVEQQVEPDTGETIFYPQDLLSVPLLADAEVPKGTYTSFLSAEVFSNSAEQRFEIEVYRADPDGVPFNSGITGQPTGDLGFQVVTILSSGEVDLTSGNRLSIPLSGVLTESFTQTGGDRFRYHVSATKVGSSGDEVPMSVFYGSNNNSYLTIPTASTTDTVVNLTSIAGATSGAALEFLDNDKLSVNLTSETQGDILYFNGTDWVNLPAGTSGQVLQTNGGAANPSWVNAGGGGGSTIKYFSDWNVANATTASGLSGTCYAVLVIPEDDVVVNDMETFLTTTSAGQTAYCGVYTEDGNTLLGEAAIDCGVATGLNSNALIGSSFNLVGGTPYWFAALEGSGAPNFATNSTLGSVLVAKSKFISLTPTGLPVDLSGFTAATISVYIAVKV